MHRYALLALKLLQIRDITVLPNKRCGFVVYESHNSAVDAINSFHGVCVANCNIRCSWGNTATISQQLHTQSVSAAISLPMSASINSSPSLNHSCVQAISPHPTGITTTTTAQATAIQSNAYLAYTAIGPTGQQIAYPGSAVSQISHPAGVPNPIHMYPSIAHGMGAVPIDSVAAHPPAYTYAQLVPSHFLHSGSSGITPAAAVHVPAVMSHPTDRLVPQYVTAPVYNHLRQPQQPQVVQYVVSNSAPAPPGHGHHATAQLSAHRGLHASAVVPTPPLPRSQYSRSSSSHKSRRQTHSPAPFTTAVDERSPSVSKP